MTNRNKAVLWVLGVFLLGALSGGTLVYLLVLPDSASPAAARPGRGMREPHEQAMKRLAKDLDLDAKQQERVDKIFQDARKKSHEAFKVISTDIHDQLKQVLRPEQLAKFDKIRRERRPPGPGDRGGPPPPAEDRPRQ